MDGNWTSGAGAELWGLLWTLLLLFKLYAECLYSIHGLYGTPYCQLHHVHIRRCWASIGDGGTQREIVHFKPTLGLNWQNSNNYVGIPLGHTEDIEPDVVSAF